MKSDQNKPSKITDSKTLQLWPENEAVGRNRPKFQIVDKKNVWDAKLGLSATYVGYKYIITKLQKILNLKKNNFISKFVILLKKSKYYFKKLILMKSNFNEINLMFDIE